MWPRSDGGWDFIGNIANSVSVAIDYAYQAYSMSNVQHGTAARLMLFADFDTKQIRGR